MTKEETIQSAKDTIRKVYPNAEFIDKGSFAPAPVYYDLFEDSIVEKVFDLASFGICVRKNTTAIIEAKNKVRKYLSGEYIIDFLEHGEPFEPIFDFKLPVAAEKAIRFLAKKGIRTTILPKPSKDQEQEIRDIVAKYKPVSPTDRLSEAASLFNDALLDEQGRKIFDLEERLKKSESDYMDKVHLVCARGREINKLNKVIHEKNMMIKNLILERGRVARLLAAEQTIHKIDLQATTSAESALIYKEKEYEKSLQEKDEVIDDLSRELARSKEREEELIATIKDYLKEIDELKGKRKVKNSAMEGRKKPFKTSITLPCEAPEDAKSVIFCCGSPRLNVVDELIRVGLWQ